MEPLNLWANNNHVAIKHVYVVTCHSCVMSHVPWFVLFVVVSMETKHNFEHYNGIIKEKSSIAEIA